LANQTVSTPMAHLPSRSSHIAAYNFKQCMHFYCQKQTTVADVAGSVNHMYISS